MSDSSEPEDEVDPNLPSAAECDRRCKEFAAITCTDAALAMFLLQDREWNLERALAAYYNDADSMSSGLVRSSVPALPCSSTTSSSSQPTADVPAAFVDKEPDRIRILSWNIDGLDQNNVITRTKGVCKTILAENPDVVFLQEVISKSLDVLSEKCDRYEIIVGNTRGKPRDVGDYFTAMMLRRDTTSLERSDVQPFTSSVMMRTLLTVEAKVKGIDCLLMTSHLESTASHAEERVRQLKIALKQLKAAAKEKTAIFGGDLNMRDKEFQSLGSQGYADGIVDVWEDTGCRPEAKFTWDTQRNDNLEWNKKFRPKCRFDRLYYRPSDGLKAVYFELVGLERLENCRRFPSDHWGILAHFNKK